MQEISVIQRRSEVAVLAPVVIRETTTSRLVFKPLLTNSKVDRRKPLKGSFVYQKKGKNAEWEDANTVDLSHLRGGEGVKLELDTAEIHTLKEWIDLLYHTYDRQNALPRASDVFRLEETPPPAWHYDLPDMVSTESSDLMSLIRRAESEGKVDQVAQVLSWFLTKDNAANFIEHISRLNPSTIQQVNSLTGVARMKAALARWEANRGSDNEKMWQALLREDSYILSQIFSFPVILFGNEAYVGGTAVNRKGAKVIDYLLTTKLTNNVILLEVKTPATSLLGAEYRTGVFQPHGDLVGPVAQVARYKQTALTEYSANREAARRQGLMDFYEAFDPRCIVIAGDTSQFGNNYEKRMSFELYRNSLRSADVVTFDELFDKTKTLIQLLQGDVPSALKEQVEVDDKPPF